MRISDIATTVAGNVPPTTHTPLYVEFALDRSLGPWLISSSRGKLLGPRDLFSDGMVRAALFSRDLEPSVVRGYLLSCWSRGASVLLSDSLQEGIAYAKRQLVQEGFESLRVFTSENSPCLSPGEAVVLPSPEFLGLRVEVSDHVAVLFHNPEGVVWLIGDTESAFSE